MSSWGNLPIYSNERNQILQLLNYLLTAYHGEKIAVIVNEFGEVGIDNQLVVGADEEIFEMNNGCICCTVRGDLIRILGELKDAKLGKGSRQKANFDLEIEPGFLEEEAHDHDDEVVSVFFRETRPLDLNKVERFINEWLGEHGVDTFRYKGLLNIQNVKKRVVFQGIHMLFSSYPDRDWKADEVPTSEFVIIGRNLDEDWFREQLAGCVAS